MSAKKCHILFFFIILTLTVDTGFLSPLSVNMILFTVTGKVSSVIVNVNTNGSVYTNGCYSASHTF